MFTKGYLLLQKLNSVTSLVKRYIFSYLKANVAYYLTSWNQPNYIPVILGQVKLNQETVSLKLALVTQGDLVQKQKQTKKKTKLQQDRKTGKMMGTCQGKGTPHPGNWLRISPAVMKEFQHN